MTWSLGKTMLQLRCGKCGHVLVTTFEDCPKEEKVPCSKKGCGGSIRTRPDPAEKKKRATKTKL